uniref:Uncharacterized protein n=1 Tax=Rhabditophanes sp. KR3021 TaxID=114890 RepID=A0AC35TGT0_9BILA
MLLSKYSAALIFLIFPIVLSGREISRYLELSESKESAELSESEESAELSESEESVELLPITNLVYYEDEGSSEEGSSEEKPGVILSMKNALNEELKKREQLLNVAKAATQAVGSLITDLYSFLSEKGTLFYHTLF